MKKLSTLFCSILFLVYNPAFSQNIRQISNEDGLENSYVTSICQDVGGVLWIGTTDGVRVLLNQEVKSVDLEDGPILEDVIVHEIAETDDGVMWIATDKGLIKLDLHTGKQILYDQFVGSYLIKGSASRYEIAVLDNRQDLFFYNKHLDSFINIPLPLQAGSDISNFGFNNDYLWTSGSNGLIRYYCVRDEDVVSELDEFDIIREGEIIFCNKSGDELYFVDSSYKLLHANLENAQVGELLDLEEDIKDRGTPTGIARYEDGFFISFRNRGVIRYRNGPDGWERHDLGIKAGVYRMKRDHNQNLFWIATEGKGLYKYWESDYSFYSYEVSDYSSLVSENINALYLDNNDHLWIGTRGSGILKLHRHGGNDASVYDAAEVFDSSNSGLGNNVIRCFTEVGDENVLIGTEGGLYTLNPRSSTIHEVKGTEGIAGVNQIMTVKDTLWISTDGGIIQGQIDTSHGFSINSQKRYTVSNGDKAFNQFKALTYNPKKRRVWVGNRGCGLYCIKDDAIRHSPPAPEISDIISQNILSLLYDNSRLWAGTGAGVIVFDNDGVPYVINKNKGLGNNVIHSLIPDGHGGVWASTNNGITNIDKTLSTIRNYGSQEGMKVTEFSDGAVLPAEDRVFFGGVGGWIEIVSNENSFPGKPFSPTIHFGEFIDNDSHTQIYLRAESKHGDMRNIKRSYKENSFSISLLVADYIHQSDIRYQYSLTRRRAKANWIDNGNSATINFSNLPAGKYILKARSSHPFHDMESNVISMNIQILPPWYLSSFAYIIYSILALMAIAALFSFAQRKEEKAKAKQMEELELQKQKELFKDKLQFFTNITHEFCTPMTLISGPCEMLEKYEKSDSYIKKYTGIIRDNILRLNSLIQSIIEFSKVGTNNYKVNISDTDISGILMRIADSFREMAGKSNIDFQVQVPDELLWETDEKCIYTIVSNLLSNAMKSTPENGTIHVSAAIADEKLAIKVRNSGAGIKAEEINHLFDRYRLMDEVEGKEKNSLRNQNGLGLAICKSMVEMLKGFISVDSIPGEYTEFNVILPAMENQEKADPSLSRNRVSASDAAKLLVVDEDADILLLMEDALSSYQVTACNNVADGLQHIKEDRPDLIITEVIMSGTNGLEFAKKCKEDELTRNIPIIMISSKKTAEEKIEGYRAGCDAYIEKPFEIDYLLSVVNRLLAKKEQDLQYNSSESIFVYDNGKKVKEKDYIEKLNEYIDKNLQSQITVTDLATYFNVSTRNLYRRFSALRLPPPNEYIKAYRIAYAGRLLRTTSLSIKEIMYDIGFSSKGHFYSEFEKKYGMPPKQYRQQSLGPDEQSNELQSDS